VPELIEFTAQIIKVQQLQNDLAVRITLDLPESCIMQMAQLAECKRAGALLQVKAEPFVPELIDNLTGFDDETEKSAEGDTSGMDSRRLDLRRSKQ